MVIHGLLVTCLDQLALIFNCLKWCFVCVGLKMFWKEANVVATFVMIHVGMYKKVYVFWKVFNVFESVLWCVFWKNGKDYFARFGQVTKSYLP